MTQAHEATKKPGRLAFLALQALGGTAVLGSYAHGLLTHEEPAAVLWGYTPANVRSVYTVSMLAAAAGYFPFTYLWLKHGPSMKLGKSEAFPIITGLYAAVLLPSALWMPLTFAVHESKSPVTYAAMRAVLFTVGAASVGLLAALFTAKPRPSKALFTAAVIGTSAFVFQTAVLDALVWPTLVELR